MSRQLFCLFCLALFCSQWLDRTAMSDESKTPEALNFEVKNIDGQPVSLKDYQGKVLLVVNVASECGATPQYEALQSLYQDYHEKGLVVLGFPCNQFGGQEPGSAEQIREFCTKNYSVTFPLFEKIEVNGENAHPFFKHLTAQETSPKGAGNIRWNFEKFLISRDGRVVARYGTGTDPANEEVVKAIEAELAKGK